MKMLAVLTMFVVLVLMVPAQAFGQTTIDWSTADKPYWALLVGGGGYTTTFTLINTKNKETQVQLFFKRSDGYPMGGLVQDGRATMNSSQYTAILPPNSGREVTFTVDGSQQVAGYSYAKIPAGSGASVALSYSFSPSGSTEGQALVPPSRSLVGLGFYAKSSSGFNQDSNETGVSLVNPGSVPANVTITLTGVSGEDVGSCQPFIVAPYSQVIGYVKQLCQLSNPYSGLVRIVSTASIFGTVLQTTMSKTGVYSYSVGDIVLP